jgi:biotin synthase
VNDPLETPRLDRAALLRWLHQEDEAALEELWRLADETRRRFVGDAVYLRGLIEFSNRCARKCGYCGIRADNAAIVRYRMTVDEIMECARLAVDLGYGTVVLQSGEDLGASKEWVAGLIRRLKAETPLAVTLSLGERNDDELTAWRGAGADRYLLRFETSNSDLYRRIHPPRPGGPADRFALLRRLRELGYEVGSGVMVGIPGQTYADLARDLELFRELDLDMIGIGPFIPHPATPLGHAEAPPADQAPATELMTYKMVALARLMCPRANIPSTTALATLNLDAGRELGLMRGANIVMPNLTPLRYRELYEIYPSKACLRETPEQCHFCLAQRVEAIGRRIGAGRGDSPNKSRRTGR